MPFPKAHVWAIYTPLLTLGLIFVVLGLAPRAVMISGVDIAPLFFILGGILILCAIVGVFFTRCPLCYSSGWVFCALEPDVLKDGHEHPYYRDLAYEVSEQPDRE